MYFTSEIRKKGILSSKYCISVDISHKLHYYFHFFFFLLCFCNEYALRMQTVEMASAGFYIGGLCIDLLVIAPNGGKVIIINKLLCT